MNGARSALVLAAAGGFLVLAACQQKAVRPPCPAGQVCYELGNGSEPISLDPPKTTGTWESRILGDLFVGLTEDAPDGSAAPGMATSWTTSSDGKVWTFHLRDAKWSDGAPVTADDFAFAFRRLMDPKTASEYAYLLYFIKNAQAVNEGKAPLDALGVRAIDPHTFEITLDHPAPYLPEILKHQITYPIPKHVVDRWGDAWLEDQHYVSNGPYKLAFWKLGDHIHATKNPYFWDAKSVCIDQVDYYPTTDNIAAERRVKRGELDVNTDVASNRVAYLRGPGHMAPYVRVHTYLGVSYLVFNTRDVPALRDRRVRQALSMGVDREFLTQKLARAGELAAYSMVPPGTANYTPPAPPLWSTWPFAKRQAQARRLLSEAGYGPGHPLKLEYKTAITTGGSLGAAALQADWRAIGADITIASADTEVLYQDLRMRNFQISGASWVADYNDATSFLELQQSQTGAQNYGDYNNSAYDALLAKADNEADIKKRATDLAEAEKIMIDDAAIAPIDFLVNKNLVSPQVTGWVDNISDWHRTRYLCFKGAGR
ncbi:MAG TPA: peptide ABC transporter substrate-binding protein [Caulobacteraceae bacterium]|nr:peptide ABC transporter substrate-binding protein [Caulobacteraceae bacterium]